MHYYCSATVTSQLRTAFLLPEAAMQQLDCAEVNDTEAMRHT
jgi:hypothetical protein